jgi:hypothetical protein
MKAAKSIDREFEDKSGERYFVYLISCNTGSSRPVKIGKTNNLARRLSNIQTGCPYKFTHVFTITSMYHEEVLGLEKLLHRLLPARLRGEWYGGSEMFFLALHQLLEKINSGRFTFEEIEAVSGMDEMEIMLHPHRFHFAQIDLPLRKRVGVHLNSRTVEADEIVGIILGRIQADGVRGGTRSSGYSG